VTVRRGGVLLEHPFVPRAPDQVAGAADVARA